MVVQSLGGPALGATRSRTLGTDPQSLGSAANRIPGKTANCYLRPKISKAPGRSPPRQNACPRVGSMVSKGASAFGRLDNCVFLDGVHVERSVADLFWRTRQRCRRSAQSRK